MAANTPTIIDTILSDITGIIPNFTSLVSSYRLLVGSAEEIQRTPGVPFEIFERAVIRYDRTGTLIDILLELLCCKIVFSSQLLAITCAPLDIIRLLSNCGPLEEDACRTAEQIIILELLRQVLERHCNDQSCFGPPPDISPPQPPAPPESDLLLPRTPIAAAKPAAAAQPFSYTGPLHRRHI